MPLIHDAQGLPKRPFVQEWQQLTLPWKENLWTLPWEQAKGLGIVLGSSSGNLGVIDVDDEELGAWCLANITNTRTIKTIRKRAHVYYIEETASDSRAFKITWHGRTIGIELKAQGTQVAAPPTPGYEHGSTTNMKPALVSSLATAWNAIEEQVGITRNEAIEGSGVAGYPPPWLSRVPQGERNKAVFIEAHKLREAGMELDQALDVLRYRWEHSYQRGDQAWREVETTVRSAYRKGVQRHGPRGRSLQRFLD